MTTPTVKSALPNGAILAQHVAGDFADYIAGRPSTQRVMVSIVQVSAVHASTQEKGRSNKATYETVHAVEITDPHEVDRLRHLITQTRADRGLEVQQPALFAMSESEQVESLIDMINEFADEEDLDRDELDQRFVDHFGGAGYANAERFSDCRSVTLLKEFALLIGAIPDEPVSGMEVPTFSDAEADEQDPDAADPEDDE